MTLPPDLVDKDAIIAGLMARIEALTATNAVLVARIAELEAKLDQPPKTPNNSSLPPSRGQKASQASQPKAKGKPHAGTHRALYPNPTRRHPVFACRCQGCGADVSRVPQSPCETYDPKNRFWALLFWVRITHFQRHERRSCTHWRSPRG